jgi:hypothetical protein
MAFDVKESFARINNNNINNEVRVMSVTNATFIAILLKSLKMEIEYEFSIAWLTFK